MRDKWAKKRMRRRQRKKRKMKKWAWTDPQGMNSTCNVMNLRLRVGERHYGAPLQAECSNSGSSRHSELCLGPKFLLTNIKWTIVRQTLLLSFTSPFLSIFNFSSLTFLRHYYLIAGIARPAHAVLQQAFSACVQYVHTALYFTFCMSIFRFVIK